MEDQQVNPTEGQESTGFTFVDESELAEVAAVQQAEEGIVEEPQVQEDQQFDASMSEEQYEPSTEETQEEYETQYTDDDQEQ